MSLQQKRTKVTRAVTISVPLLLSAAVLVSVLGLVYQNKHSDIRDGGIVVDNRYRKAFEESLGFFDNIPDNDWELMRNITLGRVNNANPRDPLAHSEKASSWYQLNWDPDFSCRHDTKVGIGDGAKWVCDPHRLVHQSKRRIEQYNKDGRLQNQTADKKINNGCLVYSVGSEGDFRFEEGLQSMLPNTCEIHTFDFTDYSRNVPPNKNIFFHNWGLKASYTEDKDRSTVEGFGPLAPWKYRNFAFKTFQETIQELGHEGRPIDIFKIDCEGCEWTTYKDWFEADLRQILIEVHKVPIIAQDFFSDIQKAGYVTFHKEPNIQWAGGDCVEYAFLKLNISYVEDRLPAPPQQELIAQRAVNRQADPRHSNSIKVLRKKRAQRKKRMNMTSTQMKS